MNALLPGLGTGSIHPMLVHFPIALWVVGTALLALGFRGDDRWWGFGVTLVQVGSVAAIIASIAGYIAAEGLGHDSPGHGMVHDHRNLMLGATALGLVASGLAYRFREAPSSRVRLGILALMSVTCIVLTLGADRGANMVYRYGVGVLREPPPQSAPHDHGEGDAHPHASHSGSSKKTAKSRSKTSEKGSEREPVVTPAPPPPPEPPASAPSPHGDHTH